MALITAKRADTCGTCKEPVEAGAKIHYNGPGTVTHEGCTEIKRSGARSGSRRGNGYGRSRSYYPTSSRGPCEDAPCCGCGGVCGTPPGW